MIRKNSYIVLLVLSLFSCGRNKYEKKMIGDWYSYEQNTKLSFGKDSLTVYDFQIQRTKWRANDTQIKYSYRLPLSDSISEVILDYNLKNNDTLLLKNPMVSDKVFLFLKSINYSEFLFKKNRVNIELEENEKAFVHNKDKVYGIKIFIGYFKNKIVAKSEYSNNLNNLDGDIEKKIKEINYIYEDNFKDVFEYEKWKDMMLHYSLFVDKKIPIDTLDVFLKKLKRSSIDKVYQVYKSEEVKQMPFSNLKEIEL